MPRGAWVLRDGELVPKSQALANDYVKRMDRVSDLPRPYVIHDRVEYKSMIDGSMITGRKQHRDHLRAHECVEVGTEPPKEQSMRVTVDKDDIARDIKTAIEQVKAGYVPPEGPSVDDEGQRIETPDEPEFDFGGGMPSTGDYFRSEITKTE